MADKAIYQLRPHCGMHVEDDIILKAGETIETDRPLDELYANKFERVDQKEFPEPVNAKGKTPDKQAKKAGGKKPAAKAGDDVTDQFEGAAEVGLKVVKAAGGKFDVFDAEDGSEYGSKLTLKKTNTLIAEAQEEEDEEDVEE